jgi:hypothetical protein
MARFIAAILAVCCLTAGAWGQAERPAVEGDNILTRYLDWADIHPSAQVENLTVFPICLSREVAPLDGVITMQQALDRGVLVVEEMPSAQVSEARFINKSSERMIFLMAGEVIVGGRQNRTLRTDALLGPNSSAVLSLYCVERGRWEGGGKFKDSPTIVPQGVRERAAAKAGQEEIWAEVARSNERMGVRPTGEDLAETMTKPENVRKLGELRRQIVPNLPRGCVGVVVASGGRIVGADLFNTSGLFAEMRDKVLNSYLSQYGWLPVMAVREFRPPRPIDRTVTAEMVRTYLRDCYRDRLAAGEQQGVGRIFYLRGERGGQVLGYEDRNMIHTSLTSPHILPVRPIPVPVPTPRPEPRPMER